MNEPATLKSLRDRPFELLAELERRGRAVTAAAASENPGAREWVGVAFRMAGELYLAPIGVWHGDSVFIGDDEYGECWILDVFAPPRVDLIDTTGVGATSDPNDEHGSGERS